jgi:hypothetical protein
MGLDGSALGTLGALGVLGGFHSGLPVERRAVNDEESIPAAEQTYMETAALAVQVAVEIPSQVPLRNAQRTAVAVAGTTAFQVTEQAAVGIEADVPVQTGRRIAVTFAR